MNKIREFTYFSLYYNKIKALYSCLIIYPEKVKDTKNCFKYGICLMNDIDSLVPAQLLQGT